MSSFAELILFAFVIGFSIFLSFPVIYSRKLGPYTTIALSSIAVGILFFLLADIFSDVASIIYPAGSYVASTGLSAIFLLAVAGSFLFLYLLQVRHTSASRLSPMQVSIVVAIAVGFQNLTEGLVFGAAWAAGLTGLLSVIFIGFILQNFTEGFPIVSPFLGNDRPRGYVISLLFLVGAVPTISGSVMGYFYSDVYLNVTFDSLAIGSIIFVIIPMLRMIFKNLGETRGSGIVYSGLIGGFLVGFLVNII